MATYSSVFAPRIPWTEELGRLQSIGLQRAGPQLKQFSMPTRTPFTRGMSQRTNAKIAFLESWPWINALKRQSLCDHFPTVASLLFEQIHTQLHKTLLLPLCSGRAGFQRDQTSPSSVEERALQHVSQKLIWSQNPRITVHNLAKSKVAIWSDMKILTSWVSFEIEMPPFMNEFKRIYSQAEVNKPPEVIRDGTGV